MANEWLTLKEEILIDSPFMKIFRKDCRSSENKNQLHSFYLLRSRDWTNIIPITKEGNVVLIKQFRLGINAHTLEIPGGVVDPQDPDIKSGAIRELVEETGYTPIANAKYQYLGWNYPNPAIQDNKNHSFIIGPVEKTQLQNLDPGEMIETCEVPLHEIPELIRTHQISHALILNAFFKLGLEDETTRNKLIEKMKEYALA